MRRTFISDGDLQLKKKPQFSFELTTQIERFLRETFAARILKQLYGWLQQNKNVAEDVELCWVQKRRQW